jgi:hypothetical protein
MTRLPLRIVLEEVTPGRYHILWKGNEVGKLFQKGSGTWVATTTTSISAQTGRVDAGEHSFESFAEALKGLGGPTLKRLARDRKTSK